MASQNPQYTMEALQPFEPCTHSDTDDSDDAYVIETADQLHTNVAISAAGMDPDLNDPNAIRQRQSDIENLRRYYKSQFRVLKTLLRNRSAHYNQIRSNHRLIFRKKRHELASYDSVDLPPQRPGQKQKKHPYTPVQKKEKKEEPKAIDSSLIDAPEPSRNTCAYVSIEKQEDQSTEVKCSNMSMPFSNYCYPHILSDKDQQLYVDCSVEGCIAPILKGQVPPLCPVHYIQAGGRLASSDPVLAKAADVIKQKDSGRQLSQGEKDSLPIGDEHTYREKVRFIKDTIGELLVRRQKYRKSAATRSQRRRAREEK
ncbi:hypothetical protein P9112_008092 [Eukaryota sp. TZLM1-RC]